MQRIFDSNYKAVLGRINASSEQNTKSSQSVKAVAADKFSTLLNDFVSNDQTGKSLGKQHYLSSQEVAAPSSDKFSSTNAGPSVNSPQMFASYRPAEDIMSFDTPAKETNVQPKIAPQIEPVSPSEQSEPPSVPELLSLERDTVEIKAPSVPKLIRTQRTEIETDSDVASYIRDAGQVHGVDQKLGLAIAKAESNFDPNAVSVDGHQTKGLFQLLDSTAEDMRMLYGVQDPYMPFDPKMNSFLGLGYYRHLFDLLATNRPLAPGLDLEAAASEDDREKLAVAAYNAGIGNLARAQKKVRENGAEAGEYRNIEPYIPSITSKYVDRVFRFRNQL